MADQTYLRELAQKAISGQFNVKQTEDLLKRIARESWEDAIKVVNGSGVGDLEKNPLTGEPVPETADQAYVRKVQKQLREEITQKLVRGIQRLA
jgi:hypothetical protein